MILSVASGKGGTGKTLVATSLALSLKDHGKVQLLDCDVEEPNAHLFLNPTIIKTKSVTIPIPRVDEKKCTHCGICAEVCAYHAILSIKTKVLLFHELCHGCGACSYLCPEKVITEEDREIGITEIGNSGDIEFVQGRLNLGEAKAPPVIKKVKEHTDAMATVIIDAPPGTSCPVVESVLDSDFCVLVTEPTPFGLNDLILAVEVVRKLHLPHAVVINRVGVGYSKVEEYCQKEGIQVLLTIPLDTEIASLYSQGITLAQGIPEWQARFQDLFEKICTIHRATNKNQRAIGT